MYLHTRMFSALALYVFYSNGCNVRAWNLFWSRVAKLVLWQLMILLPCTLLHKSSIPMGGINFNMQQCFSHSLIPLLFKCSYVFYFHGCNVRAWNLFWGSVAKTVLWRMMILLPCTLTHVFYSHGCNKFLHARTFFTLMDTISIQMPICLLFPWVQCQSLKPVLSQCSQTSFVTVDDFIALYTHS